MSQNLSPRVVLIGSSYPSVGSGNTMQYRATFKNIVGQPIAPSDLTTLDLSLIDTATRDVVNGVDHVNILNQDRGSIDSSGVLTVTLGTVPNVLDTTLLDPDSDREVRSIVLHWTYNLGTQRNSREVDFEIIRLAAD